MNIGFYCFAWMTSLVGLLGATASVAQERYRDSIFADVVVESGVQYGAGRRDGRASQPLLMDIYMPAEDTITERPAIVLAFPGGFVSGARDDDEMVFLATSFARRGYVAVSIDYRLIEGRPSSSGELQVHILEAVHDMRAAVRFLREDAATADRYGTNGQHVFVGGISAGAVMAAGVGVLNEGDPLGSTATQFLADNGGMEGNSSDNTQYSSAVSGVLQISGAIRDTDWIGADSPPIYAAHEEFDPVVPCGTTSGLGFIGFALTLRSSGACDMIPAARDVGVPTEFFFEDGSINHVGFSDRDISQILDDSAAFFVDEVLRPRALASAVLPGSRSVEVGELATVFSSIINVTEVEAMNCRVHPMTDVPISFSFQAADSANSPVGEADTPFAIPAGSIQNLILSFTPTNDFDATDVYLRYECDSGVAADSARGLNTVLLSGNDSPIPDVIGLTTVVDLVTDTNATALFAVGSANVGAEGQITVSVDDGGADLPLQLSLCRTDSATGVCLESVSERSELTYSASSTESFAVFATVSGEITNNPARHRIFVRFVDSQGQTRGSTSTAVRTN